MFATLLFCTKTFAFNFDSCKTSLQDVLTETNQLQQYGSDLINSVEALKRTGRYSSAIEFQLAAIMVPMVRSSAFGLATIGAFYDSLDFSKFAKKNAQNLYTYRMNDFYLDVETTLKYIEEVAPLMTDASTREDAKKVARELRLLKAKYRYCEK